MSAMFRYVCDGQLASAMFGNKVNHDLARCMADGRKVIANVLCSVCVCVLRIAIVWATSCAVLMVKCRAKE